MAFQPIDQLINNLGKVATISFSEGIRSLLSQEHAEWEMVYINTKSDEISRQHQFSVQDSFGPASIQLRSPGANGPFPRAQSLSTKEGIAQFKEINASVSVPLSIIKALETRPGYVKDFLKMEIDSKGIASRRLMAQMFHGDGTGIIGTVASQSVVAGQAQVVHDVASRGHIGWFELGDLLLAKSNAGAARTPSLSSGTFYAYKVVNKVRATDTVTLQAVDANEAPLVVTATNLVATDYFIRVGQPTAPDLTSSISDYGTVTEAIPGLESLCAADGRVVHQLTMTGALASTVKDGGAAPLDVPMIDQLVSDVKTNVGASRYNYKMMLMAQESRSALVEAHEVDRRFVTAEDATTGVKKYFFQHGDSSIALKTSEFNRKDRVWILPEKKGGEKIFEYRGTDFMDAAIPGQSKFAYAPSATAGLYDRSVVTFMVAYGTMICHHARAVGRLENFTV